MDEKKYLDYAGLQRYDRLIKALIGKEDKAILDKLKALIGSLEKGEDEATILDRIDALETAVGDVAGLKEEFGNDIADLVRAIVSEAQARKALDEKLYGSEGEDGDIETLDSRLEVVEKALGLSDSEGEDKSFAERVGDLESKANEFDEILNGKEAEGEEGQEGYVPAQDGLITRMENAEAAINTLNGEGEGSVKKAAEDATAAAVAQLISDSEDNPIDEKFDTLKEIADWILSSEENAEGLNAAERLESLETVVGKEAEGTKGEEGYKPATGLVKDVADNAAAIAAEEQARKDQIGDLGKVSEEEGAADHTVKSYVDAAVAAINGNAEALEERTEALEATHAKKTVGEGEEAKEVFKTVAEEIDDAFERITDAEIDELFGELAKEVFAEAENKGV